jgi:glycerate 2-kinase
MNPDAASIFRATLATLDVGEAVRSALFIHGDQITLSGHTTQISDLDHILIVSVGKAGATMYEAARKALAPTLLPINALVVTPEGTLPSAPCLTVLHGAHPSPDAISRQAAQAALALLQTAGARTLVLFLISGGASSMLELPLDPAITLAEVAAFYKALVGSGLSIEKINTVRKHFSAVKGGRLALAAAGAAAQATLLVSDVPAYSLHAVASGPSMPDPSTREEMRAHLASLLSAIPPAVAACLADPALPETPKDSDPVFARATFEAILSSDHMAAHAAEAARALGYTVLIDSSCDDQPYRQAADYLLDRATEHAAQHQRACLISVGEVTVTVDGPSGRGGRNQQFALYCAGELARRGLSFTILSAGSDGIDGHSPAAGAVVDQATWPRASAAGFDPVRALATFDAYPLFEAIEDALMTGPTGNNLRDLRVFLSDRQARQNP